MCVCVCLRVGRRKDIAGGAAAPSEGCFSCRCSRSNVFSKFRLRKNSKLKRVHDGNAFAVPITLRYMTLNASFLQVRTKC